MSACRTGQRRHGDAGPRVTQRGAADFVLSDRPPAIRFWGFTTYGVVVTVATLLVAWLYVYLRYVALA